jgi:hypothetical protein
MSMLLLGRRESAKWRGPTQCHLQGVHRQRADDAERPLREIDDAGDAINEREPQRNDGEHAALEQPADDDRGHFV